MLVITALAGALSYLAFRALLAAIVRGLPASATKRRALFTSQFTPVMACLLLCIALVLVTSRFGQWEDASEQNKVLGVSGAELKTYTIVVLAGIASYFAIRRFFRKIGRKLPSSTSSWRSYLRGQGTLLLGFLLIGGLLASVSSRFGPWEGKTSKGGRVIEYSHLNPSEHVVYEEQDVEKY